MTLSELKAVVLASMTTDEVKLFGDLRKKATWEAALASKKVVSNDVALEVSNPVSEPVSEANAAQTSCAVEAEHLWLAWYQHSSETELSIWYHCCEGEQWLSCELPQYIAFPHVSHTYAVNYHNGGENADTAYGYSTVNGIEFQGEVKSTFVTRDGYCDIEGWGYKAPACSIITKDDSIIEPQQPCEQLLTSTPTKLPQPAPVVESTVNHAEPIILILTILIVMTNQIITTLTPIITYLYSNSTSFVNRKLDIRRRRSRWYAELKQLMNDA